MYIKYFASNYSYFFEIVSKEEYKNYLYWRIEYTNKNGEFHRLDGPAIESSDDYKKWFKNGLLHREDGPAVEYDGRKQYWYNNELINLSTDKEFKQYLKMKVFM
jgi:hypothetical protein